MGSVRIVVDEASELEGSFIREKKVIVIPFKVITKQGSLLKISPHQNEDPQKGIFKSKNSFFNYLDKAKKKDLPTTGAVSVEKCEDFLREASRDSQDVVCVLFPPNLSKIFRNVERAAEKVSSEFKNKIKVVDTKQAFSAQYFMAKEAAELAEEGKSVSEIEEHIQKIRKKVFLFAAVYRLKFLRRSGRVRRLKRVGSYFSDLLRLSSIITLKEGEPTPIATVPRMKVATRILAEVKKVVGYKEKISIRINYGGEAIKNKAQSLQKVLRKEYGHQLEEISSSQTGKLVGCHTGPHVLSLAVRKYGYKELDKEIFVEMMEGIKKKLKKNVATLNRLNIFPVIDGDTGKNFMFTFHDLKPELESSSLSQTIEKIASQVRENGTGFSGTAMAAYFSGFASCFSKSNLQTIDKNKLVEAMEEGTQAAYLSFRNPKEGTILTAMRVSSEKAKKASQEEEDIAEILKISYQYTVKQLLNPEIQEVPILKRKGVVDAGGLGFVDILEGWLSVLGKERELKEFVGEFRDKIKFQKSSLDYKMEEARHPGFCLKINIKGLKNKEELVKELEAGPNPIESPLSIVHHHLHIHVYNQDIENKVLNICNKYGRAYLTKKSPLSLREYEILKNKILSFLGKVQGIPKLVLASLYWFGLRIVFPFREIRLWKQSKDLFLVKRALEEAMDRREVGILVFDRKGKIKYYNQAAQEFISEWGGEEIKKEDDIKYYLSPQIFKKIGTELFSLGKNEPFFCQVENYSIELRQLFREEEHVGGKVEIRKKSST